MIRKLLAVAVAYALQNFVIQGRQIMRNELDFFRSEMGLLMKNARLILLHRLNL